MSECGHAPSSPEVSPEIPPEEFPDGEIEQCLAQDVLSVPDIVVEDPEVHDDPSVQVRSMSRQAPAR